MDANSIINKVKTTLESNEGAIAAQAEKLGGGAKTAAETALTKGKEALAGLESNEISATMERVYDVKKMVVPLEPGKWDIDIHDAVHITSHVMEPTYAITVSQELKAKVTAEVTKITDTVKSHLPGGVTAEPKP